MTKEGRGHTSNPGDGAAPAAVDLPEEVAETPSRQRAQSTTCSTNNNLPSGDASASNQNATQESTTGTAAPHDQPPLSAAAGAADTQAAADSLLSASLTSPGDERGPPRPGGLFSPPAPRAGGGNTTSTAASSASQVVMGQMPVSTRNVPQKKFNFAQRLTVRRSSSTRQVTHPNLSDDEDEAKAKAEPDQKRARVGVDTSVTDAPIAATAASADTGAAQRTANPPAQVAAMEVLEPGLPPSPPPQINITLTDEQVLEVEDIVNKYSRMTNQVLSSEAHRRMAELDLHQIRGVLTNIALAFKFADVVSIHAQEQGQRRRRGGMSDEEEQLYGDAIREEWARRRDEALAANQRRLAAAAALMQVQQGDAQAPAGNRVVHVQNIGDTSSDDEVVQPRQDVDVRGDGNEGSADNERQQMPPEEEEEEQEPNEDVSEYQAPEFGYDFGPIEYVEGEPTFDGCTKVKNMRSTSDPTLTTNRPSSLSTISEQRDCDNT